MRQLEHDVSISEGAGHDLRVAQVSALASTKRPSANEIKADVLVDLTGCDLEKVGLPSGHARA
jgi:hypothetical protein